MFEKNLQINYLLDFYGDVLPERIRSALRSYYDEDLSLSEIADSAGISRQGVRHLIKRGEEELLTLESHLGLAAQFTALRGCAAELASLSHALLNAQDERVRALAKTGLRCVDLILGDTRGGDGYVREPD